MKKLSQLTTPTNTHRLVIALLLLIIIGQIALFVMFFRLAALHDDLSIYAHDSAGNINTLSDCVDRDIKPCELPNHL